MFRRRDSTDTCQDVHVSLRFAILGSLSTAPSSGYQLARLFDTGLGWFWSASHSQIYPELRRLEEAGLITGSVTTVGERLEKRVYSVTPQGLAELTAWVAEPPHYRPNRDPERIQLIFSDLASAQDIRRHLERHVEHFTRRRDQVRQTRELISSGQHERVQERLADREQGLRVLTLFLREIAYDGDVERAELEVAWAKRALRALDEHERLYDLQKALAASKRVVTHEVT